MSVNSDPSSVSGSGAITSINLPDAGEVNVKTIRWDQLSKADQDKVIEYLLSSSNPILQQPTSFEIPISGSSAVAVASINQNHQIISDMLDTWLKGIAEQADLNKKAYERREIEGASIAYHNPSESLTAFSVGVAFTATGAASVILFDPSNIANIGVNPIVNMAATPLQLEQIAIPFNQIALMSLTIVQSLATLQFVGDKISGKGSTEDGAYAKKYAESMLAFVGNPAFTNYLTDIVTRSVAKGEPLNPEVQQRLVGMMKLVLLSTALGALYIAEAGKITSQEFAGMLSGNIKFEVGDIRETLINQIKANLKLLTPRQQEAVLSGLFEFFDSNPSWETLYTPSKAFASIFQTVKPSELRI